MAFDRAVRVGQWMMPSVVVAPLSVPGVPADEARLTWRASGEGAVVSEENAGT